MANRLRWKIVEVAFVAMVAAMYYFIFRGFGR